MVRGSSNFSLSLPRSLALLNGTAGGASRRLRMAGVLTFSTTRWTRGASFRLGGVLGERAGMKVEWEEKY